MLPSIMLGHVLTFSHYTLGKQKGLSIKHCASHEYTVFYCSKIYPAVVVILEIINVTLPVASLVISYIVKHNLLTYAEHFYRSHALVLQ